MVNQGLTNENNIKDEDTSDRLKDDKVEGFTPEQNYRNSLEIYKGFKDQVSSGILSVPMDPYEAVDVQTKLHEMHEELLEKGSKVGKSHEEVLMDLLLLERNLAEYNLPDIPVRKVPSDNAVYHPLVINGRTIDYNSEKFFSNGFTVYVDYKTNEVEYVYGSEGKKVDSQKYPESLKKWLQEPHVLLVYSGNWVGMIGDEDVIPASDLKGKRLRNAAIELGLDAFEEANSSGPPDMHWPQNLHGLVVPYRLLPDIAGKIRDNKDKYWVTDREASNLFSQEILEQETVENLRYYYNGLVNKILGLYGNIKEENYKNWDSLLNVILEIKRRSKREDLVHREDIENYNSYSLPNVLDVFTLTINEAEKDKADLLREKMKRILSKE